MSVNNRLIQGRINNLRLSSSTIKLASGTVPVEYAAGTETEKSEMVRDFARQRDLFQILLHKTEGLARLSCLSRPGFQLLADLAQFTLAAARKTDRELARGADLHDPHIPQADHIEHLIEQTSDLQDRLQRQLALVAQLQEDATELRAELELLIDRRNVTHHSLAFDGIRALSRRLISELLYDVTPPVLHPRLAMDVLTERLGNETHARAFAVALGTASLVARVARVTWLGEEAVELITSAALLQDCGKLVIQQYPGRIEIAGRSNVSPRHTQIGAAMVGSYRNAPAGLADLIATHHQRLGNPALDQQRPGISGEKLRSPLQAPGELLAAASRFERLRVSSADRSTLLTPPELVDRLAMSQLWRETLAGDWNEHFVRKILVQRDGHLECVKDAEQAGVNEIRPRVALEAA